MLTYLLVIASVGWLSLQAEKFRNVVQVPIDNSVEHSAERKQGLWYLWLAAAVLILVSGLRYGVGADYFAYAHKFYAIHENFWEKLLHFKEPANLLLLIGCRQFSDDFMSVTMVVSFITIGLVFLTIHKYSEDYFFSALLFILIGSWHGSFNAIRQYLAMAILFAGHRFIFEQKHWQYLGIVVLASCFHVSALFMYPCYFLLNIKKMQVYIILLMVYGLGIYFNLDRLFDIMTEIKGIDQVVQSYSMRAVNVLRILVSLTPLTILFTLSMNEMKSKKHLYYIKLIMLNSVMLLATNSSAYLARASIYTDIYSVLAFPCIFRLFPHSTYRILKVVSLFLYSLFWYVEVTRRETLLPFRWVFER